jgi:isopentenyl phosphate kinase
MTSVISNENELGAIDCVIKLGGSALTDKKTKETFNDALFEPTLNAIVEVYKRFRTENGRNLRCILIHGAGSFAHPHAKAGKVHLGIPNEESASAVVHGLCDTRLGLHKLSHRILDYLVSQHIPTTLSSAFPGWKTETHYKGQVKESQTVVNHTCQSLSDLISILGVIPVLHGDCVLDVNQKTAVLSGDLILDTIAKELKPKYVVYVSDVEGVLTAPPFIEGKSNPEASLIPEIQVFADGSFEMPETTISCVDVSGGMAGKLAAAASTAARGTPVFIVKGGSEDMIQACLGQVPKKGTLLKPHESRSHMH